METQQGIYVGPDNVRANKDRERKLGTYFVTYTVGLDHYSRGVAIVRAYDEKEVEELLKKEGVYCSLSCLYHIKEITKIPEDYKKGVLVEDVKLSSSK